MLSICSFIIALISGSTFYESAKYNTSLDEDTNYDTEKIKEVLIGKIKILIPFFFISFFIGLTLALNTYITLIDSIFNIITIPIMLIFIYFYIKLFYKNYPKFTKIYKETINYLALSVNVFCYSSAFVIILALIFYTNSLFSISKTETQISEVVISSHYITSNAKSIKHNYVLSINPPIYGLYNINVTPEFQKNTNKGDKIKAYIKKGIFGIRYFYLDRNIIKSQIKVDNSN